jgi:hypothetical protein
MCLGLGLKLDNFLMSKILGQWWDFLPMKTFGVAKKMGSSNAIWLSIDAK